MIATHRCRVCGAFWIEHPDEGGWSLVTDVCGECCDNAGDFPSVLDDLRLIDRPTPIIGVALVTATRDVWVVHESLDKTEGRGGERVRAVCELRPTAERISTGLGTQGAPGRIESARALRIALASETYAPASILPATPEDRAAQAGRDLADRARAKMREAGLTDAEIKAIADDLWRVR